MPSLCGAVVVCFSLWRFNHINTYITFDLLPIVVVFQPRATWCTLSDNTIAPDGTLAIIVLCEAFVFGQDVLLGMVVKCSTRTLAQSATYMLEDAQGEGQRDAGVRGVLARSSGQLTDRLGFVRRRLTTMAPTWLSTGAAESRRSTGGGRSEESRRTIRQATYRTVRALWGISNALEKAVNETARHLL